ncbi:MAG: GNAT family N-acetyltransferase, partial [Planctomycetes bacterium]|nr:GNAT family N-acetyltransferase [Planctomycetota bacterium]
DNAATTLEFRYRLGGRLVGVAYVGEGTDALNSIYSFADPSLARRSLGTFDVLSEIQEAARRGKEYLYLGYHVRGCSSMEYKAGFRPFEVLRHGRWEDGEAVLLGPP